MTLQRKRADCVRRHVGEGRAGGSIDRKSSTAQQDEQDRREIRIQREGHSPEFGCALFKMLLFHSFFHVALAYFLPTSSVSTTIHPRDRLMKRGISLCTCTCTCLKGETRGDLEKIVLFIGTGRHQDCLQRTVSLQPARSAKPAKLRNTRLTP